MSESKPNKYFKCISNRTSAILYLCLLFVFSLCFLIYSIFKPSASKFIFIVVAIVLIIYIIVALYQLLKNDKLILERYTKGSFIFIVILFIILDLLIYFNNEKHFIELVILDIIVVMILLFGLLTYSEYYKEKKEINNHTQNNRQLEQGN
ncbi:hypothetical protein BCR32DRAFT_299865 [Anaeromyces robustus]|uniref:MARVEL domain-containing protein n=1 Tax=Anaeromyces robustus TaxID=1754192 RepID=A0A1Y1X4P6_9FUNG|nr:hypothetical protein BCR32DRAFT_299865 [Anaeromyces robustus]|eukprot:ORX80791.1 hypothetical protein BCR32DRAFT_299865 [Anaeromyces robustus]